jgi:hypothetical protein
MNASESAAPFGAVLSMRIPFGDWEQLKGGGVQRQPMEGNMITVKRLERGALLLAAVITLIWFFT